MTDIPARTDPDYSVTVTVRDGTGLTIYRVVKPISWQLDHSATRDDGQWSPTEKRETLFGKINEAVREAQTWLRGRDL